MFGKESTLEKIFYFSAIPDHLNTTTYGSEKIKRHRLYLDCLKDKGILVELGRFKEKETYCTLCGGTFLKHEEKETDVAIGARILEIFYSNECDTAVIVSGDTDLAPVIRRCHVLFVDKKVVFCFPYRRRNDELFHLAPGSFSINKKQYINHQFANPLILKTGISVSKPSNW